MRNHIYLYIMLLSVIAGCNSASRDKVSDGLVKDTSVYDVAAYYWPAYHVDTRFSEMGIFNEGKGEWEVIYNAVPKFEGHDQPLVPLWGYEDESDPAVVAKK